MSSKHQNILITGGCGYIGSLLVELLHEKMQEEKSVDFSVIAMDICEMPEEKRKNDIIYIQEDICSDKMENIIKQYNITQVVHLAAVVTPSAKSTDDFKYAVGVLGTKNLLEACIKTGVRRFTITSSGAAYGYYADNPEWLSETDPLRGNEEFAYAYHKRLVEEMLDGYREKHPELEQVVFRVATVLGKNVNNRISKMFERKRMITVNHSKSPFVFIWDEDLACCLEKAIFSDKTGVYNVAGDGSVTIYELAKMAGKKCRNFPLWLMKALLFIFKKIGISRSGPEVVNFLLYRPVLSNEKLKKVFGYIPRMTSKEVFEYFLKTRNLSVN
ncbi:NAD-dependent epimerase/dehydratase family protein [Bacteroidales bacterium AH-315-I05]|nr:NAD-dependent epimerase/dehydratase family protein [Bacteroidales bacterium AH-315-I05]